MKLSKEYILIIIVGLYLLAYLLDAVVNPLDLNLASPYHYLNPAIMMKYPFTTTSLIIKSIALFLTPVWLMSFLPKHYFGKASFLLIISSLVQLYALQDVVTQAAAVPLEWSLSLSLAGIALLVRSVIFFLQGFFFYFKDNLGNARIEAALEKKKEDGGTTVESIL